MIDLDLVKNLQYGVSPVNYSDSDLFYGNAILVFDVFVCGKPLEINKMEENIHQMTRVTNDLYLNENF